jgi:hypothetical protein
VRGHAAETAPACYCSALMPVGDYDDVTVLRLTIRATGQFTFCRQFMRKSVSAARGARYNSSVRYLSGKPHSLAVVISEGRFPGMARRRRGSGGSRCGRSMTRRKIASCRGANECAGRKRSGERPARENHFPSKWIAFFWWRSRRGLPTRAEIAGCRRGSHARLDRNALEFQRGE